MRMLKDSTMRLRAIPLIVIVALAILVAPFVAVAQPAGKVPTIGFVTHNAASQTAQAYEG
jgi:hypothetical protein